MPVSKMRIGLEIHQQLDSEKKLFCNCRIKKKSTDASGVNQVEEFPVEIRRRLRPVVGELREIDPAALSESLKSRVFIYKANPESSCLVELDDDPPRQMNKEALMIALQACTLLNCDILDEIYVMRKTVIDGSSVSGFQRTALIGTNGFLETSFGKTCIETVCIEEDSAPAIKRGDGTVEYRLDRLGVPLIEIATSSDIHSPEHAKEVAERIGLILRSLPVVRGIGSIRQDVNVSIEGGSRVEIKGFQELDKMPKLIEAEVSRQSALIEIKSELHKRGLKEIKELPKDVTEVFKNTKNNFLSRIIKEGGKIVTLRLPCFAGLLKKDLGSHTMGKELSSYAKAYGYGIIHSDEDLDKYGLAGEFISLKKCLKAEERDAVLIVAGPDPAKAMNAVLERARQCLTGVPEETRVAEGIDSIYARPLPGSGRMYPETDITPIKTSGIEITQVETLLEKEAKLKKKLPEDMAKQIIRSKYLPWFEEFGEKNDDAVLIANTFLSTFKELSRKGLDVEKIKKGDLGQLFSLVEKKKLPKKSLPDALIMLIGGESVNAILGKFGMLSDAELKKIILSALKENPGKKETVLMGIVMSAAKGMADGEKTLMLLKEIMKHGK